MEKVNIVRDHIVNHYSGSPNSGFLYTQYDEFFVIFKRFSGDTLLIDSISFEVLFSLDSCNFENTNNSHITAIDFQTMTIENIQPYIDHLVSLDLIKTTVV